MRRQTTVTCNVPYGSGGLGQHFAQIVEEARDRGEDVRLYSSAAAKGDEPSTVVINDRFSPYLTRYTPLRFYPGAINHLENVRFDRGVAARLQSPIDSLVAFGGKALLSFQRARQLGAAELIVLAANSHVKNVARMHEKSIHDCPLEQSWLSAKQIHRTMVEYEMADRILIASQYSWETFVREGVPERKLHRVHYRARPRFVPAKLKSDDGVFRVVYIGSITVMKGIHTLLEAFFRLDDPRAELILIGGTATRGMRKYMERWLRRDTRVRIAPGDPLPHLHRASVCVHPSYEDNLAYAVIEAMAAGVPTIVSADTGAKEYVREGVNGYLVPTGDWRSILERLQALRANPMVIQESFHEAAFRVAATS